MIRNMKNKVVRCLFFFFAKQIAAKENAERSNNGDERLNKSSGRSSKSREAIRVHYPPAVQLRDIKETSRDPINVL